MVAAVFIGSFLDSTFLMSKHFVKMAFWPRSFKIMIYFLDDVWFQSGFNLSFLFKRPSYDQVRKINAHGDGVDFELATIGWLLHK